ncbi:MAG: antibiotic biosynthesis monooxygenase family protein [Solirubrobacteraceae bacterium]
MGPVLELAEVIVRPGTEQEFETAFAQAQEVVAKAEGFRGLELWRSIERPGAYRLLIGWETLEDHMAGFRESELFVEWRRLIGGYFAQPPTVEHATLLARS